jgi:hypothetical protein
MVWAGILFQKVRDSFSSGAPKDLGHENATTGALIS